MDRPGVKTDNQSPAGQGKGDQKGQKGFCFHSFCLVEISVAEAGDGVVERRRDEKKQSDGGGEPSFTGGPSGSVPLESGVAEECKRQPLKQKKQLQSGRAIAGAKGQHNRANGGQPAHRHCQNRFRLEHQTKIKGQQPKSTPDEPDDRHPIRESGLIGFAHFDFSVESNP